MQPGGGSRAVLGWFGFEFTRLLNRASFWSPGWLETHSSFLSVAVIEYFDQKATWVHFVYDSTSQSITKGNQGRILKADLCPTPQSMTPKQGTQFTAKEARQEPQRMLLAGVQVYTQLSLQSSGLST